MVSSLGCLSCYGSQGQHQVLRQLVAMHLVHLQHHHIFAVKVQSVCCKAVSQSKPSSGELLGLDNISLILQAQSMFDWSKHGQGVPVVQPVAKLMETLIICEALIR